MAAINSTAIVRQLQMSRENAPSLPERTSDRRSVAVDRIGIATTGDHARVVNLATGTIPMPADVDAPSGTLNLPRRPVTVYVGRDLELRQLSVALADEANAITTHVIYGLGGVGKSEFVLQYAYTHRSDYDLVWWIFAEDQVQILSGMAALAARLCPEIGMTGTTADAAEWAIAWLKHHQRWLLILDHVNDPDDVESLLGQLMGGHIVLTTRRDTGWGHIADPIRLDVLDAGSACDLITARIGHHDDADRDAAALIAAELGYLPLALDQAAAYILQTRITPATYLTRLKRQPAAMYAAGSGQAQRTISRVWDITIEEIRSRNPAANRLLHILAYYAAEGIPRLMLGGRNDMDKMVMDEALGALASYSMVALTPRTVGVHRLVQAVVLARGADPERDTALVWLNDALPPHPDANVEAWPLLRDLAPHVASLASHYGSGEETVTLGWVLNEIALFYWSQGDYQRACMLHKAALKICERTLGLDHADTATYLGNLAAAYGSLGRFTDALPLEERALAITEAAFGPDHPETALRLGNLAATFGSLGRFTDALPLEERALAVTEAALGPDHPDTALRLGNLAATYKDLRRFTDALPLEQRALAVTEAALGPDHPDTALRLGALAVTYVHLGRHADALPLAERAQRCALAAVGADHDTTQWLSALTAEIRELGAR